MKQVLKIIISSLTLFSLIGCVNDEDKSLSIMPSSEKEISDTSSAQFSKEATLFHVTFLNYDDSLLYEVDVKEGETATYVGETPTKPEDDEYTYEFSGWDKDLDNILSNLTTKAMYDATRKEGWGSIIWF